jgi:hypothetical protein
MKTLKYIALFASLCVFLGLAGTSYACYLSPQINLICGSYNTSDGCGSNYFLQQTCNWTGSACVALSDTGQCEAIGDDNCENGGNTPPYGHPCLTGTYSPPSPVGVGSACTQNSDCISDICTFDVCSPAANGGTCAINSDCQSNFCNADTCGVQTAETSPILTLPDAAVADLTAFVGHFFSDLWVLIALVIGIPLAFYVIRKIISLVKLH